MMVERRTEGSKTAMPVGDVTYALPDPAELYRLGGAAFAGQEWVQKYAKAQSPEVAAAAQAIGEHVEKRITAADIAPIADEIRSICASVGVPESEIAVILEQLNRNIGSPKSCFNDIRQAAFDNAKEMCNAKAVAVAESSEQKASRLWGEIKALDKKADKLFGELGSHATDEEKKRHKQLAEEIEHEQNEKKKLVLHKEKTQIEQTVAERVQHNPAAGSEAHQKADELKRVTEAKEAYLQAIEKQMLAEKTSPEEIKEALKRESAKLDQQFNGAKDAGESTKLIEKIKKETAETETATLKDDKQIRAAMEAAVTEKKTYEVAQISLETLNALPPLPTPADSAPATGKGNALS